MAEKIVLVDGYSLMYRAFHALPLMDNGEGEYTNAIFGFMSMLFKVLAEENCKYCAVAFDEHGKTFRHEKFADYKAGRAPTPEEMRPQIPRIRELLTLMGIAQLSLAGYEADDILGTVTLMCEQMGVDAVIVTGDRDAYQLAGPHTCILYTKRGISETERVTPEWIFEKYGVTPAQMIDIKGLMGDASDNIPGVPGVGEKTAVKLVREMGTLENVLDTAGEKQKGALLARLTGNADQARASKFLATIDRFAPISFDIEACRVGDFSGALDLMRKLKLKSVIQRIREMRAPEAAQETPAAREAPIKPVTAVSGAQALADCVRAWFQTPPETLALHMGGALSMATDRGERLSCEMGGDLFNPGLSPEEIALALAPVIKSAGTLVIMHNIKAFPGDIAPFEGRAEDTLLAAYVLNPQRGASSPADACAQSEVKYDEECPAASLIPLFQKQLAQLRGDELLSLYRNVEMPLTFVLRDMENAGFRVDAGYLAQLDEAYKARISQLDGVIRDLAGDAGRDVNFNSPKQLAKLLFEDMGLPYPQGKKSKTGTSAEVLEELAPQYPICAKILEYRKYQKLSGTYTTGLTREMGADGRVHTCFEQAVTGTGRISSREPNLQNIPVRTELGREIRRAFIARDGWVLVDADYSQIELRVLAHMANDEGMRDAFLKGQDIHARTAAEVYGVALADVTREMRSNAKAVNFGIVYGISDFGLARNIGVSRHEAAEFIEKYFRKYPNIKKYMDAQVAAGKMQGYVTTMLGRRRYLPELQSPIYNMRAFGERAAMNSPIQGTAADIIKLAMVNVHARLKALGLRARLILQVHDELIVESPPEEKQAAMAALRDGMETVMRLSVPLVADVSTGGNWNECKS